MDGKSLDIAQERLNKLKEILPDVFTEGKIDWEKLQASLGGNIEFKNERYVLNWADKSDAFRVLQSPTTATLVPCKEESIGFDETENIFIEGENLEVLKVLQKSYFGKIKIIYIDPPYNTGNDKFIYPDKFSETKDEYLNRIGDKDETGYMTREGLFRTNSKDGGHYHSNWLSMMYPRLFLARNLLREDGVIFVSIDDNEVHNLRLFMNEVFGEENFISCIIWKKKHSYGRGHTYIIPQTEYILCYSKNINDTKSFGIEYSEDKIEEFDKEDRKGKYRLLRLWHTAPNGAYSRPTLQYQLYTPEGEMVDSISGQWLWNEDRIKKEIQADNVVFVKQKDGKIRAFKKDYLQEGRTEKPTSLYDKVTTDDATKDFNSLLPEVKESFFTKPSKLILDLISWVRLNESNSNEIILDFFGGSCTTAQAVLELNKEDRGDRKFILVQLPEKIDEKSEAFKAGYENISEIGKERIRRVIKNIIAEKQSKIDVECNDNKQDLGFKVFKLQQSNFKVWRSDVKTEDELYTQLTLHTDPVEENAKIENILYELLLKSGIPLTARIEEKDGFYCVNKGEIILILKRIDESIVKTVISEKPKKLITLDRLFKNNDQLKTNTALQLKDSEIDFRVV